MGKNNYIKNRGKNNLVASVIVVIAVMTTGCTIASTEIVEVIYAPQVHTSFENDPNAAYYRSSRYFIYDNDGLLIRDTVLNYENASELPENFTISKAQDSKIELEQDKKSQIIFRGLPEGDYKLVAFHNADNCNVVKSEPGVSTASELRVIAKSASHLAEDHIFTSNTTVKLARGVRTMLETEGLPLFYRIEVVLTGVDEMSSPPIGPYIVLDNIRKQYTSEGIADVDKIGDNTNTVKLHDQPVGKLAGSAMTNKFFDEDLVVLKLYEEGSKGLIGSAVISPSDYVDINSSNLPELFIQLRYFNTKFEIWVDDWVLLDGQDAPVGG